MNVEERNELARYYVNAKLGRASELDESYFIEYPVGTETCDMLTDLIEVNAKGFRGVVLTAIVGMEIEPTYDPLVNFYACNPRSIFEKGIWYALTDNNIPCGKSDPLNVAKNINRLDEAWAQGRRPQKSATAAIEFLRLLSRSKGKVREKLIDYFFYRLFTYARLLSGYEIVPSESKGLSNRQIAEKLCAFILAYPEAGQTPQFLISNLIEASYHSSNIEVKGGGESVFGTNTTSKKPADIWTELAGQALNLYEITVKKVDYKRLDDCIGSLQSVASLSKPVTFICRIPEDVTGLTLDSGAVHYKGKTFDFVDIREFVFSISSLLRPEQLHSAVLDLENFINDVNISLKTKQGWNNIFASENQF